MSGKTACDPNPPSLRNFLCPWLNSAGRLRERRAPGRRGSSYKDSQAAILCRLPNKHMQDCM